MKFSWRNPFFIFGLVLLWRVVLLVFTAQPIPANDAGFFDGALVNWILHGHYFNPSLAEVFPISGRQVFSAYPPLYQGVMLVWMLVFGVSVIAAMALHLCLFAAGGLVALVIVRKYFPASVNYALVALLFFGFTFGDRPESLAHVLGLTALLLLAKNFSSEPRWRWGLAAGGVLFLTLYTSVIVGAFYFGAGFVAAATAWWWRRNSILFAPFVLAAALFAGITFTIARTEPLLWAGFLENARQTPVLTAGLRRPDILEIIKLIRTAPVFLLALVFLPLLFRRRREVFSGAETWPFLLAGVFTAGWALLVADMTLLAPNYVAYVTFAQIILTAGLLALAGKLFPGREWLLRVVLAGCVVLVSVRAIGMTTWGAACAWKNTCWHSRETLRVELEPFTKADVPVVVSSAFLYSALEFGVRHPVHSDWYFDRSSPAPDADFDGMVRLRPPKLVLNQFDYYRAFVPLLEKLRRHPELVQVQVRDFAAVRTPDSIPSLQRVVQHISWAPVIVDLHWQMPAP